MMYFVDIYSAYNVVHIVEQYHDNDNEGLSVINKFLLIYFFILFLASKMKNRINVYILVFLSLVLGCYASQPHAAKFKLQESFSCQPSATESCFPFIIHSKPENFRDLSQIVYTIRMNNPSYKETVSYLNQSEYFEYHAGFAQIDDPLTFDYSNINYTEYINYTTVVSNTAMKFWMTKFDIGTFPTEKEVNSVVIQIWGPQEV